MPLLLLLLFLFNVCRVASEGIFVFWFYELSPIKFATQSGQTDRTKNGKQQAGNNPALNRAPAAYLIFDCANGMIESKYFLSALMVFDGSVD